MKVLPLGERVLIRTELAEVQTKSSIIIPQTAQEKTQTGVVVAVGDSKDIKVKVGDNVMYDKYAGTSIKIEGVDHLVVRFADILAIVE